VIDKDDTQSAAVRRPLVAGSTSNRALWIFGACALAGGTALFASLESKRAALVAPAIEMGTADNAIVGGATSINEGAGSIAPIQIPADPAENQRDFFPPAASLPSPPVMTRIAPPLSANPGPYRPPAPPQYTPPMASNMPPSPPVSTGPEVVYDASRARPSINSTNVADGDGSKPGERVQATHFANPSMTVPRGTVIQAVMESALDSTRAGLARAIVSRDVFAFDGSKVVIQRGSRLIGEYKADLSAGQARALIQWQRLMRPDGVIVNLDSPSADPLGRAGLKGKVHGHFVQKFGGAILQSALNVGQQVAVDQLSAGTTIYAMGVGPGSGQNGASLGIEKIQPTLTVKQGASVSVFVARDLDFSSVGQ